MPTTTILVVDDEKNMRTTLADILADEGYEVSTAENGERAVKMCAKRDYDFVLMDVRMPGIDGVEAFRRIREKRSGARVIMMSAYSLDMLRRKILDDGALAFLRKPLDIENLIRVIRGAKETTVLAIEAEPWIAGTMADDLRREGYRLRVVEGPDEAVELVRQIHFDVILVDSGLAESGAGSLLGRIQQASPSSSTVLVRPAPGARPAGPSLRPAPDASLAKPFGLAQLLELLARMRSVHAPAPGPEG